MLTLAATYAVHEFPRRPVHDPPNWGRIEDLKIQAIDGGVLEVWRVTPEQTPRGTIILAHGWGRNRDRMMARAQFFGSLGFTTVLHSARDHGGSSPCRWMNAMKFAEDIEAVTNWLGEKVIIYGHSAGAGGAIIAASRNQERIHTLFLEACYAHTEAALLSLYRWFNPFFGYFLGPMIIFWMNRFYHNGLKRVSPARLAPQITIPTLIIHGEKDQRFPVTFARELHESFPQGVSEIFVAKGAHHSESSQSEGYREAVRAFLNRAIEN